MSRYFMELAYKGSSFCGWQRQPNGVSVQGELEKGLALILRSPVAVTGAGRTDAGVHAKYMVAHFDFEAEIKDQDKLALRLSKVLSPDIVVYKISQVGSDAHSRFDALARRYDYWITTERNPFLQQLATQLNYGVDFALMNRAAAILTEYSDFSSFSKLHSDNLTNICKVEFARWEKKEEIFVFTIQADRFLRNMVRAIVGTLLDVGRGRLTLDDFRKIIESKNRGKAGTSAPAQGLYLVDVIYPQEVFIRSL